MAVEFVGRGRPLFRLALATGFLTLITLGIYRFWMKTRIRRWYWSAIRPGGIPLEYTGLPVEKLTGFLIAVVILAFYIGVVNLILMFLSFSILSTNVAAYAMSLVGVVPIWFFARYRARRYMLARTRWRGIRFALAPGAWGYAWRALLHWLVTLLTLGILWPRMTFWLEKFRTDRTYYGTLKLGQGGNWQMLMPHFAQAFTAGALSVLIAIGSLTDEPAFGWLLFGTVPWFGYGVCRYIAGATRALAETKHAEGLGLIARPIPQRVARIYLFGTLGAALIAAVPAVALSLLLFAVEFGDIAIALPQWVLAAVAAVLYFALFLFWGTLRHTFVLMPLWRHYAETLTITGATGLATVRQRSRDGAKEAGGFAEALDVGAAI